MLERAVGPVLDIGCGVGRHVVALRGRGVRAVGVEISSVAVAIARERGAEVIEASAFEHPTTSDWRTILLLDGNIGIGGDAVRLLRRAAALLAPGGAVLVELDEPAGAPRAQRVRLEGARASSHWIPWHFVDFDQIDQLAGAAGFVVTERWRAGDRWFAHLRLPVRSQKPADERGKVRTHRVDAGRDQAGWGDDVPTAGLTEARAPPAGRSRGPRRDAAGRCVPICSSRSSSAAGRS